jgi:hypothetical protein
MISASLACRFANRSLDGLGEDVPDTGCVFAQDMGVDAQGYGGVGVAEAAGYDVDGDSGEKQRGRVQVAQIVQQPERPLPTPADRYNLQQHRKDLQPPRCH